MTAAATFWGDPTCASCQTHTGGCSRHQGPEYRPMTDQTAIDLCRDCGGSHVEGPCPRDAQMAADTTLIESAVEPGTATVYVRAPGKIAESDPRFYMDADWRAWFWGAYPEWSIEDFEDSSDPEFSWRIKVVR